MTHHIIPMFVSTAYDKEHYNITHRSAFVYDSQRTHSPMRLVVWDNMNRPNPYRNAKLGDVIGTGQNAQTITEWFLSTGRTKPRFYDPHNEPTDEPFSFLLSLECTVITNSGTNTGTIASGQVYAPDTKLMDGDTATLKYTDGTEQEVTLHIPRHNNGHGHATPNS